MSFINYCSLYLDLGLVLLILKVFDHVGEPNGQTIVTVIICRYREYCINKKGA